MLKSYLYLLAVGAIWGSQFIVQETALTQLPPLWVGVSRSTIGCMTLVVVCAALGLKGNGGRWPLYALIGLLEAALPFVLVPWGQQYLDSSIAAILMGTVPFFAILFAPLLIQGATITLAGTVSVMVGFTGLLILFSPDLARGVGAIDPLGALAILCAAACFGLALLLLRRCSDEHPIVVARNVLAMASLQIVAIAIVAAPISEVEISGKILLALLYLGIMCAGVVYYLYMTLINEAGAVFASMTNYLVPAFGVFIGATLNHEVVSGSSWLALVVILAAVAMKQLLDKP